MTVGGWLRLMSSSLFEQRSLLLTRMGESGVCDNNIIYYSGQVDDILLEQSPIELENIFMNVEGERKVVLVDSAPGSGSTMAVNICQRWSKGELFQEFTIVILVQLRDLAVQRAKSIADLLPCRNDEMAHQVASAITASDGRGILWVMDGWDDLPARLRHESFLREHHSIHQIAHHSQLSDGDISSNFIRYRHVA